MFFWLILLIFLITRCSPGEAKGYSITFEQQNLLSPKFQEGLYKLTETRVNKFNRTTYVWNFDFEVYIDMDTSTYIQMQFYHKQLNNEWDLSPFSMSNMTWTEYSVKHYRPMFMKYFKCCSNWPQFGPFETKFIWPKVC